MRSWIQGGKILTPDQTITGATVIIEDGKVSAIEPDDQLTRSPQDTEVFAAGGLYVMPGLIDAHVHGGASFDTMDATPQALAEMSNFFLEHGVTAYLPTTVSQSGQAIERAIENVARNLEIAPGAQPLGVHLEGPYICHPYRGAHAAEWLRSPDPGEYRGWLQSGVVRLIALAPELPGALDLIRAGVERGVRFSAGHTQATMEEIQAAVAAGLSQATHTFNGMAGLHHRDLGTAGAVLANEQIYCEIIADGTHVHPEVLKMVLSIKGLDRTLLVTDAMRATGLSDGPYDLGGQTITVTAGVARTAAGGLAGSTLTLDRAVANIRRFAGLTLNQAVHLATVTPAAALGLLGIMGEIRPGLRADLLIADEEMNVKAVMTGGKFAYRSPDLSL